MGGRLADKNAIITGAGSGIGRGIACRFAAEGVRLMLSDITETGARETAALIADAGGEPQSVLGDVAMRADADRLVEAAGVRWGRPDVAVNHARIAGSRTETLAPLPPE